ncbi:hsp70 family protein [Paraliomyxa miuraensis]|uniref:hsp70 family protein n=1 Tax=Paraliomyxa miuraensis TaxID=376150 RepID=UPI00224DC3F6|nr:hsp70 family protein [Paraliomyxa miuraensis]MCX4247747.1 hsp70 family protein [Paraliomyxa miuraensis]
MGEPRFAVGIDLGTTHCAISSARLDHPVVRLLPVPQLIAPGEVAERPLLPSFTYLPAPGELSEADRALPWGSQPHVVGEVARRLGAKVPGRLVASAKSWVCHGGVNRRAPILPWNSPDDEPHVSPFEAQVGYLAHLRRTWEQLHPDAPLSEQDVVVTVPASFDEGARTLTTDAAQAAGLGAVRLLEEPQAAFYDYLGTNADALDPRLAAARLVLVVDVGGGTTDLTLLRVLPPEREGDRPAIERIAVGGHLMLGGDNMDAALAVYALQEAGIERPSDATVWSGLVQSARQAKERLLSGAQGGSEAPDQAVISYVGRGSRLVGSTRSITLDRQEVQRVLLDGFLPLTGPAEVAERTARAGLTTLGLPYATDASIGRHVCSFLRRHVHAATEAGARVDDGLPRPDLLLLNGGVFNAPAMIERLGEVLAGWYGEPVPLLPHTSLETAVAHGAVRSALARRGLGEVIGGGTARAYYVELAGADGTPQALCIAPRGMEEGASASVPDRVLELLLDRLVAFPLHAYTGDRVDPPGALVELRGDDAAELEPLPPLETVLRDRGQAGTGGADGRTVPVTLSASLSLSGALELYLVTVELPPRRWRLEFVLRSPSAAAEQQTEADAPNALRAPKPPPPDPRVEDAIERLERVLADKDPKQVKGLRRELEKRLDPRAQWSVSTCRALGDALLRLAPKRGQSDEHELNWLRLLGWCLRPGFGDPGDEARLDALWALRDEGLRRPTKSSWAEYWIAWRRVAPGLSAERQRALLEDVRPWLWRKGKPPPGPPAHGPVEMMQLLATLERIPAAEKQTIGELLIERAKKLGSYWPLGRVGARVPLQGGLPGDAVEVVGPTVAEGWLSRLLALDWSTAEGASFAAASLAASTGDPARDVSAKLRGLVVDRLGKAGAPASWIEMVTRPTARSEGDATRMFGDSLPVGLRLT